jgi:superfamily II DNA/RNA helicase
VIARILQAEGRGKTVIFTRTKRAAAKLAEELHDRGFNTTAVHGDMNQEARERSMAAFKAGKKDVMVATDVAARGIDVDDVTHVINHTIPEDEKNYLHRVGRTGRAGKTGIAVTFVDWDDMHKWTLINNALDFGVPEPVETYSSSPHLYTDLDIPAEAKGRLPGAGPATVRPRTADHDGGRSGGQRHQGARSGQRTGHQTGGQRTAASAAPVGQRSAESKPETSRTSRSRQRTRRSSPPAA